MAVSVFLTLFLANFNMRFGLSHDARHHFKDTCNQMRRVYFISEPENPWGSRKE